MLSKIFISVIALSSAVSAFKTDVDHNSDMTSTQRANTGYSIDEFNQLVDDALAGCDSNGCDVANQVCNIAHCISIDGDNYDDNHDNIIDSVATYIKQSMNATDSTISTCSGTICENLEATTYEIPGYISLRRNYDDGSVNALYKIDITETEETNDACGAVFDALSAATSGLEGPDVFGIMNIIVCQ